MPVGESTPTIADQGWSAADVAPYQPNTRYSTDAANAMDIVPDVQAAGRLYEAWGQTVGTLGYALSGDRNFLADPVPMFDAKTANEQFGVPGYLRFDRPVSMLDAWAENHRVQRQLFTDRVMSRTDPNVLMDMGSSLTGALMNPVNDLLMASGVGEELAAIPFGERVAGLAGDGVAESGTVWNAVGRSMGRTAIENAPYVAKDAAVAYATGHPEDFDMGQELANVAGFAVLHGALRSVGALRAPLEPTEAAAGLGAVHVPGEPARPPGEAPGAPAGAFGPEAPLPEESTWTPEREARFQADMAARAGAERAPPPEPSGDGRPDAVERLPPAEARGAWGLTTSQISNDEPVTVGKYIDQAVERPGLERLDERSAMSAVESWRPLPEDAGFGDRAITTRGTEVPVRYGLVEADELVTSHDNELNPNGAYPGELQPRERERAGSHARNLQLEKELNPRLLMADVNAAAGAPVVSPGGVVESGNGRTIALRRSAETGTPAYQAYRAELQRQGLPVDGMRTPILVRMRTEPMTGAQRAGLAHEMNADVTERMSAPEQAMADAGKMDPATMAALQGDDVASRRRFARTFIERVAPDQIGDMVDKQGHLSAAGERRISAAMVAKAYGDQQLVEALFETGEDTLKGIGRALVDVAPDFAMLHASIDRGEAPTAFDIKGSIVSAVMMVKAARESGEGVGTYIAQRLASLDMFQGNVVGEATELLLRTFYRNEEFTQVRAADKVAEILRDYARSAMSDEYQGGVDLFGNEASIDQSAAILRGVWQKWTRDWDGGAGVVRAPGVSEGAGGAGGAGGAAEAFRGRVGPGGEAGGRAEGGGVPAEGGGRGAGQSGAIRGAEREPAGGRAGEPGGRAEPAVSGEPGREPGAQARPELSDASARAVIAEDPGLQELLHDVERLEADSGKPITYEDGKDPAAWAEAAKAVGVCMKGEL